MIAGGVFWIILLAIQASNARTTTAVAIFMITSNVVQIIVSILVFVSINMERAFMMLPMLVFNIFQIIRTAILIILSIVAFFSPGVAPPLVEGGVIISLAFYGVFIALEVWFFTVFRKCYKYLKENESGGSYGEVEQEEASE
ncbi:hypothetical protein PMAYCL1PPCAC_11208 [Pristionchus mayeri]|uniref:G protein-coupled receptor n=1 Tax=Pristionchus mayeri TaxID=1317129 RepID=A0AAN5C823_9BILA|nr:hypothetical protein PMAYCL1PPCAC_11208 [Pristionchus mayeri]